MQLSLAAAQADNPSPTPPDEAWRIGEAYQHYMGRWSRQLAPRLLDELNLPAGRRWRGPGRAIVSG